jgi:hypothetical protein
MATATTPAIRHITCRTPDTVGVVLQWRACPGGVWIISSVHSTAEGAVHQYQGDSERMGGEWRVVEYVATR